ncbi:MAG: DUF2156 domain-containing protein [Clostridia bacterium]|nr:DUF2156 domain-containing protein [Clostridia bacterium]
MSNLSFGELSVREIGIKDRDIFYRPGSISFCNFSNIYAWRHAMNYRIAEIDGFQIILGKYRDDLFTVIPPFHTDSKFPYSLLRKIKEKLGEERIKLCPITSDALPEIKEVLPEGEIILSRELFDYFYNTSDLINLSGKKFHQKRNHVNSFTSKYSFEYIRITADNTDLLKEACETLYDPESGPDLADEHIAINELIENFSALGLAAGVIVCDGKPVAYSIGEHMSDDVALIHIEKADKNFSGSFATINKIFAEREFSDTLLINREEDMGLEGLRKAKLSYHPANLGEYYTVII